MKIERTKNAKRNVIFGTALKLYQILLPFLMRTAMIYCLGVQYLGLNSLFTSILQVLNLAELGVGSAMVFSMYKPIAEDDHKTICALINLYKWYYRIIGAVVLVGGVLIVPFIPNLIEGDIPSDINVYVLYLLNLGATVLTYWLFAYRNSILQGYQRNDVASKVTIATDTVKYALQIGALFIFHNYYYYVIAILLTQAIGNIATAVISKKMYPQYDPKGKLPKEEVKKINGRIRDLFTAKLGFIIVNYADTIVISAFLGLTVLAVYQNYYFLMTAVIGLMTVIFQSCTAGIGNSIIVETKEKNYLDFKKFTMLISWVSGICTCCFLCLYQPFMELWVGKDLMLSFSVVICFCIYYFVYEINQLINTYKDAAGMWHEDRWRPLVTALTNLVMNLIMVQFWGIYGVMLSTVLSTVFVGMPWLIHNLFTVVFERKQLLGYIKTLFFYVIIVAISCFVCGFICSFINLSIFVTLIVRGIVCVIVPNIIYLVAFRKKKEFKGCIKLLDKMTKGKLNKVLVKLGMD
ncbi:MAG: oligosaccharide flippase family protein [Ruminococcus sp.]|nr:oligosaccharide flippase family protein [Ruminococcus sp.]